MTRRVRPGRVRQPLVEPGGRARHEREQGELVDDPVVERRRLEKEGERLIGQPVELRQVTRAPAEQLGREDVRALLSQQLLQHVGQVLLGLAVVDAPHDAVDVKLLGVVGREVQRDEGRVGPVEQPGWQAVVRGHRKPVPHGVAGHGRAGRILAERAEQRRLHPVIGAAEPHQGGDQRLRSVRHAAKGELGAEAAERLVPGRLVKRLLQLVPRLDAHVVQPSLLLSGPVAAGEHRSDNAGCGGGPAENTDLSANLSQGEHPERSSGHLFGPNAVEGCRLYRLVPHPSTTGLRAYAQ